MPARPVKLTPAQLVAPAPLCAYCGKRLKLDTYVYSQKIGERLPQPGDEITLWRDRQITIAAVSKTWTDPAVMTNRQQHTNVWSGEFYEKYGEFDQLKCALKFARAAYRAGYRITKKET